jgi:hypothetical protein
VVDRAGPYGFYWSAAPNSAYASTLSFYESAVGVGDFSYRAYGFSVRCVKE